MGKLFSAYGPSSILEKNLNRRNRTQAGPRLGANLNGSSSPGALVPKTAGMLGIPAITSGENEFTEDDEEDPDFSGFEEPVVIRLMADFNQKKSV